ncbi:hypothetical protein [Pseudarthrobacter sp. C4D7]|uniref:hypothetical protein n=1 Tax=Pseudarthrobacter sp. C4D7 TaxID=2735268 RepID=UPI001584E71F|nr:hypothetical protein [Pseudarthrobacter sp. C4D7]NUT72733.1 hypothetical protein [Pseudarthrobacter sp. C4D7]
MNHDEELRWVRRREGTRRSGSRETSGYDRDLLRENDTGKLLGPSESRPANIDDIIRSHTPAMPPDPTVAQQIAGQVASDLLDALRPYIMHGVDAAVDAKLGIPKLVKWAKSKSTQRRGEFRNQSPHATARLEAVPAEVASDIDDEAGTLGVQKPSVTAEQYQAALRSVHEAEKYAAQGRQWLADVSVRDGAESAPQAALEDPASSIDEATQRPAVERLDRSRSLHGEFMVIRNQDADTPPQTVDGQLS